MIESSFLSTRWLKDQFIHPNINSLSVKMTLCNYIQIHSYICDRK